MTEPAHEDIHNRIQNTVAILKAELQRVQEPARHDLILALETLEAADAAVTELEAELDLVTSPDLTAAEEAQKLRHELEAAELKIASLEQKAVELRDKSQLEDQIHEEEHRRLKELEKQAKDMERILETDAGAFGKFMDRALDKDEKRGRFKERE